MIDIPFGEWLKRQRKKEGLTQEQLAQQVNCSAILLRKIEAEERRPSEQIAVRLAEIFKIPASERAEFLRYARGNLEAAYTEAPTETPWSASTPAQRTNLPASFTSLVGRVDEIAAVCDYLQDPGARLVTLVGPPGIGKTRLSLEAARASLSGFPDGVFFVSLAPLEDANLLVSTIAQALGYVEARNVSINELLTNGIGHKRILLVLDNCEHLIDAVATLVAGLLPACPGLTILTTSREVLRVPGEWIYTVPALNLPGENAPIDLAKATQFPALTLFAERARAVRPGFKLAPENIETVAKICAQLDGLPLAIELIAARMRIMSPQMLLEKMTGQFILSADGMRAVSARQKTLNHAIGWSYDFLPPEEQKILAVLSVFSSSFTMEAAEAILSAYAIEKPPFDSVNSLADKSLLQRSIEEHGETRYSMLDTIHQFASDRLRQSVDESQVRDAHLAYFLSLAEQGDIEMRGPHQAEWADRIQGEQNNLRAALEWAVSSQKTEAALRLLSALGWPWEIRGHYSEAASWLARIRALPGVEAYPLLLSRAFSHIGRYLWTQHQYQEALQLAEVSRAIAERLGEQGERELANALNWLGLQEIENDIDNARKHLQKGLELNTQYGDTWGIAISTFHLGILESVLQQTDIALALLEKSLAMFRQSGDLFFISRTSIFLGGLYQDLGQYDQARQLFEQHLSIDTRLHFWDGIANGWVNLGNLARQQGEEAEAKACFDRARVVCYEHCLAWEVPE